MSNVEYLTIPKPKIQNRLAHSINACFSNVSVDTHYSARYATKQLFANRHQGSAFYFSNYQSSQNCWTK